MAPSTAPRRNGREVCRIPMGTADVGRHAACRDWRRGRWVIASVLLLSLVLSAQTVRAQSAPESPSESTSQDRYVPISGTGRLRWIARCSLAPRSLAAGVLVAGWQTAWNLPREWDRTWTGAGKRYLAREPHVAVANLFEAGLGALWGEDPRYIRSGLSGIWPRAGHAIKSAFLAPGPDGRLRPAWARYVGNATHTAIEATWLPPSTRTTGQAALRFSGDFGGQIVSDLWDEFWPDVHRLLRRRRHDPAAGSGALP